MKRGRSCPPRQNKSSGSKDPQPRVADSTGSDDDSKGSTDLDFLMPLSTSRFESNKMPKALFGNDMYVVAKGLVMYVVRPMKGTGPFIYHCIGLGGKSYYVSRDNLKLYISNVNGLPEMSELPAITRSQEIIFPAWGEEMVYKATPDVTGEPVKVVHLIRNLMPNRYFVEVLKEPGTKFSCVRNNLFNYGKDGREDFRCGTCNESYYHISNSVNIDMCVGCYVQICETCQSHALAIHKVNTCRQCYKGRPLTKDRVEEKSTKVAPPPSDGLVQPSGSPSCLDRWRTNTLLPGLLSLKTPKRPRNASNSPERGSGDKPEGNTRLKRSNSWPSLVSQPIISIARVRPQ